MYFEMAMYIYTLPKETQIMIYLGQIISLLILLLLDKLTFKETLKI